MSTSFNRLNENHGSSDLSLKGRVEEFSRVLGQIQFSRRKNDKLAAEAGMKLMLGFLEEVRRRGARVFLAGNGGSSALVSHALTDFINVAGLRVLTLHESALLTCMANDYGYENAFARILNVQAVKGDLLIAVSSSGRSPNIHHLVQCARKKGVHVITLSGFDSANVLRSMGDLNIWIDSRDYGLVEIGHLFILHNIADRLGRPAASKRVSSAIPN